VNQVKLTFFEDPDIGSRKIIHVSTLLWVLGFCWPWIVKYIFSSFLSWQVWFMGQFSHILDDFD
jgi:hypothetical protein